MNHLSRRALLAGLALAPSSCTSILPSNGPPPQLYTLTPVGEFSPPPPRVSWQLLIDVQTVMAALDTERIALTRSPTTIDYFADSAWDDRAPLMVQSLLVESFEDAGAIAATARESTALRADYILRLELRHFEAVYTDNTTAPKVRIEINAKLVRLPDRSILAQRSFTAALPAQRNQVPAIVEDFDAALHDVMRKVIAWTLGTASATG